MNISEHYNSLYQDSIQRIISDKYSIDNLIDSPFDTRRGITLLIRPNQGIKASIEGFLNDLKQIEPEQYYQPTSDLHITVLSIITCYEKFKLSNICIQDYVDILQKNLKAASNIEINFKGVTASPSAIMIQGFLSNDTLNVIRDNIRVSFRKSGLQQSIDSRYSIQSAHMTVVRFRKPFAQKTDLLKRIENYREFDFGTFSTNTMELVYNDWYQRKEFVKELHKFEIK